MEINAVYGYIIVFWYIINCQYFVNIAVYFIRTKSNQLLSRFFLGDFSFIRYSDVGGEKEKRIAGIVKAITFGRSNLKNEVFHTSFKYVVIVFV